MKTFLRFLLDDTGATAVEYGLLAGILGVALIVGFGALSNNVENVLNTVSNSIKTD
ncbi:Flp family type IVb pilin [Rhizobium sp. SL86]|uniref:Flp family type IVb pilin n=1 Tax=Rhizobium sp. SL86 TaxID=2995148 RepID=UPI0022738160|nr:Flp family type IVb pilin [Rhizobium sp. SL86]MCY1665812.1 Flp family type IVb pilin [Rhizobium sp. SL86]